MNLYYLFKNFIQFGTLEITDASGKIHLFTGTPAPHIKVTLHDPHFAYRFLLNPTLTLGESYMNGELTFQKGTLFELLSMGAQNRALQPKKRHYLSSALSYLLKINSPLKAKKQIHQHYDLNEKLYRLFLDSDMQYSCAYFAHEHDTLETAQENKKRHIAAKLQLQPGQKVLDIGSGWGGLALHLAQHYDVTVTGLTLSEEQLKVSNQRAQEMGLSDRVRFYLKDYRLEENQYDRVVSVGMFEHVGAPQHAVFFNQINRLLTENGLALIHSIGHPQKLGKKDAWFQKYIFPGGDIPALSQAVKAIEGTGMHVGDIEILRHHYAKTLDAWHERFQKNRVEIKNLYDERFCKMWEYYLLASEVGFLYVGMMVFQIQILKNPNMAPLTRDYMFRDATT